MALGRRRSASAAREDEDEGEIRGDLKKKEKGQVFECEKCSKVRGSLGAWGGRGGARGVADVGLGAGVQACDVLVKASCVASSPS